MVFAIFGFLAALAFGLYLIVGGLGAVRLTLGFTGTLKSRDGLFAVTILVAGIVITAVTIYFAPFHVSFTR